MIELNGLELESLQRLTKDGCENFTTGIGSCYRFGRTEEASYLSERCCTACVVNNVLLTATMRKYGLTAVT